MHLFRMFLIFQRLFVLLAQTGYLVLTTIHCFMTTFRWSRLIHTIRCILRLYVLCFSLHCLQEEHLVSFCNHLKKNFHYLLQDKTEIKMDKIMTNSILRGQQQLKTRDNDLIYDKSYLIIFFHKFINFFQKLGFWGFGEIGRAHV